MKLIVILSGGLDSTVLAQHLISEGHTVEAVSFDYGQRHRKELKVAADMAARLGITHTIVDISAVGNLLAAGGSSLVDMATPVPLGHYEDESMKATVVPNRNMIMLSIAGGIAIARSCGGVAYGAHAGDHAIYPDCRDEFAVAVGEALSLCDWSPVALKRPFIEMTKADIVRLGDRLGVPMHETWSCYQGGEVHCGKCGTCVERREAFDLAGVPDRTSYER